MSVALREIRARYRAAQARLWRVSQRPPVKRDVLNVSSVLRGPAWIYITPIGPTLPLDGEALVLTTSADRAKQIAKFVAEKHGLTLEQLVGRTRSDDVVKARHEVFYRLRKETTWSLPRIGRFIGGRDHTTVLHGIRKHEMRLRSPA